VLKEETGGASSGLRKARIASGLVVAQISLSLLLLVSAGLFVRALRNAERFDPGFNQQNVLLANFDLFPAGYNSTKSKEFQRQLLAKLETVPGLQSVALANWVPLGFSWNSTIIQPEGYVPRLHESMDTGENDVSPYYFQTMQIPLITGRDFTAQDVEGSQKVAIVNQTLASRYWPGQDVLGKRIHAEDSWYTVVGVARDSSYNDFNDLNRPHQPFIYLPLFQEYARTTVIHARVSANPLLFRSSLEEKVREMNADLPLYEVSTLESRVQVASSSQRIAATFVGAFGLIALVLAAVGIYGVLSYTTRQRTREIGIRMALGAQRMQVLRHILRQGVFLTVIGVFAGVALSLAVTHLFRALLFGVTPTDPLTFLTVGVLLSLVALAACFIPARRATKVDPIVVLRYE
jgi:predicted permease